MIKNYFKTAWRSLLRNKTYSFVNVAGLSVGIAACLLIFLIVQFETSFESFNARKDHIYRVVGIDHKPAGISYDSGVPLPTAEGLRVAYPQLAVTPVIKMGGQITVAANGQVAKKFEEKNVYFTDPDFFSLFDFNLLAGDKRSALSEPNSALLTEDAADKYFGDWKTAIGKTITYENKNNLKVTGILKNIPANTDFDLQVVVSFSTLRNTSYKDNLNDWVSTASYSYCFVLLPEGLSIGQFNKDLVAFTKSHKPAEYANDVFSAIPLSDMHHDSRFGAFGAHTFSKQLIGAITLIGLFLVVIACVNFINLSTAQAVNRSKEVGVRKVLGSSRHQLIWQFMSETFIITVFSIALSLLIARLSLSPLNQLLQTKLAASAFGTPGVLMFLGALIVVVTLLSGFYPALVLSGFNPVIALKNRIAATTTVGISLRRGLVVFQFCIAQVLVISTLVIIHQMDYFSNRSLGFDKDAVVNVPIPLDSLGRTRLESLRNQLLTQPGIKDVSFSHGSPSDNGSWTTTFVFNNSPKKADFNADLKWADPEYFNLYHLKFTAGHSYEKEDKVRGYVVNETFTKQLGFRNPGDIIGKTIGLWNDKTMQAPIVGVVKDFNVTSLSQAIPPVIMGAWSDGYQNIDIKLNPADMKRAIASVEQLWESAFPGYAYQYHFLDDKIAGFYQRESQLSALYKIFAGIAIFISCLGLYGLISFMAVQRIKEVGIRKTLGASVVNIVYLFSKEFTMLIIIAFLVSAPVGWYLMSKWLQGYAYKITIGPGLFLLCIGVSVCIAWATVGYKAIKAALANPVKSLRSE